MIKLCFYDKCVSACYNDKSEAGLFYVITSQINVTISSFVFASSHMDRAGCEAKRDNVSSWDIQ